MDPVEIEECASAILALVEDQEALLNNLKAVIQPDDDTRALVREIEANLGEIMRHARDIVSP